MFSTYSTVIVGDVVKRQTEIAICSAGEGRTDGHTEGGREINTFCPRSSLSPSFSSSSPNHKNRTAAHTCSPAVVTFLPPACFLAQHTHYTCACTHHVCMCSMLGDKR